MPQQLFDATSPMHQCHKSKNLSTKIKVIISQKTHEYPSPFDDWGPKKVGNVKVGEIFGVGKFKKKRFFAVFSHRGKKLTFLFSMSGS